MSLYQGHHSHEQEPISISRFVNQVCERVLCKKGLCLIRNPIVYSTLFTDYFVFYKKPNNCDMTVRPS